MKEGHIFTDSQIEKGYVNYLKDQVSRIGAFDKLVHHITTPGGDVYEGYEAYHFLRGLGKPIRTVVEGQCQSIGTLIMLAGDEVISLDPSRLMVHEASIPPMGIGGTADVLERGAIELKKINAEMAQRYAEKTGKPLEAIVELMKKETPMSAHEAKSFGFVDNVVKSLGDLKVYNNLKAVALGKDMNEGTGFEKLEKMFGDFFAKFSANTGAPIAPKAIDLATADGKTLVVDSQDGDLVGKSVTVDGAPAEGTYPLADGRSLVCVAGKVTEVKEAMTAEQKEIADLKSQLQAIQTEKQALEAAKQSSDTQLNTVKTDMEKIQTEIVALKKMTIGNPNPAGKGKVQTPVAFGSEVNDKGIMDSFQKEILTKAGLLN